jgi:PAS domain-containing protein
MTGTNEDINQEMLLRIKTKENENRIIGIYNSISAGIALGEIILDNSGKPIDYKCLQMNNYLGKIIGVNPENFPNENSLMILPDNGRDWISMFGEAAINGKSFAFEDYYENTDKYYNVSIYSPNPKQFTLLVTDITENKRKENELIEKYEELQAVYEELSAKIEIDAATVDRYIKKLVEAGILIPEQGKTRGRKYYFKKLIEMIQ